MRQKFATLEDELQRSEDYTLTPRTRSGVRHDLMDDAEAHEDVRLWRAIAEHLVRAYKRDDLSPEVSDHFVDACPDEVFKEFAFGGPNNKFHAWRRRAHRLCGQAAPALAIHTR